MKFFRYLIDDQMIDTSGGLYRIKLKNWYEIMGLFIICYLKFQKLIEFINYLNILLKSHKAKVNLNCSTTQEGVLGTSRCESDDWFKRLKKQGI